MKNEDKIIELLAEMVHNQDITNQKLDNLEKRVGKTEKELAKTNAQLAEHSRAILKLADKLELVVDHEKRTSLLEWTVYK